MRTSELTKILNKSGCYKVHEGRNHEKWYSPKTNKFFIVPRHASKEVPTGTANNILKAAGLK